jgi:DNA invertase Pin-like site-specific DNA recombinase
MKAVAYYRFSSDKSQQVRNSEDRQMGDVQRYCEFQGVEIVAEFIDKSISGDDDKPELENMKQMFLSGECNATAVIISEWTRITRKDGWEFQEDVKWIKDLGLTLILAQAGRVLDLSNASTMMEIQWMVSEANRYLKNLSANVISGMISLFEKGELGYTNAPFGYDLDGEGGIIANDDILLVKQMFDAYMVNESIVSLIPIMSLGAKYQKAGVNPPSATSVKTVLRNPIYVGIRTFGVTGTGKHGQVKGRKTKGFVNYNRIKEAEYILDVSDRIEPVVNRKVFDSAQKMLDNNITNYRKPASSKKYKRSGLVRCECGAKLLMDRKLKGDLSYACPYSKNKNLNRCSVPAGRKTVRGSLIEGWVKSFNNMVLRDKGFHKAVLESLTDYIVKAMAVEGGSDIHVLQEIEDYKSRKEHLTEAFTNLDMNPQHLAANLKKIDERIAELQSKLTRSNIQVYELLSGDFISEGAMGVMNSLPDYMNRMMGMAKILVGMDGDRSKDATPVEGDVLKSNPEVRRMFNSMMREVIKGNEFSIDELIDEIEVEWKKVGNRNYPKRVTAVWRINHHTTHIDADDELRKAPRAVKRIKSAMSGAKTRVDDTVNRMKSGVSSSTDVRIVFYPTSKRYYFKLERVA